MFYRLVVTFLIAIICVYLGNHESFVVAQSENKNGTTEKHPNDTILEFFYNCTCTPFYLCSALNDFMVASRINPPPKELRCTDPDFLCCKNTTEIEGDGTEEPRIDDKVTTTPRTSSSSDSSSITTTSETPEEERKWDPNYGCGIAKTEIGLRILTPETESAATIPGEIPWIVEIFQKRNNRKNPYLFKCAGTLIHPKVVLTATHRIISKVKEPQAFKVVATSRDTFQNLGVNADDERNVAKIIKHPGFYSGGAYNDLSLLILDKEYNFTNTRLNSICLPKANQSFVGRRCLAVGWGENKDLKSVPLTKVDIPVVDFQRCQTLLRKTELGEEFNLHSSFLCAGGEEGKDTCKGDGGGPLMCVGDDYQFVQTGIVSWGAENKCGVVDQPGVYVDVAKFTEWIEEELDKNGIKLTPEKKV
ncbi:phenoloxidase-activating factor 2-like [Zophobas morio]|uniref:phenoloxidase-activating factor 2-like n=1 Tax=Zophobas morio TaxID=2755281 RepID=UPI003083A6D3